MSRRSSEKYKLLELPRSDRDLGIHAAGRVELSKLDIDSVNKSQGSPYEPTPHGVLEDMLLDLDIEHQRFTFVDLGAGKGRILCLAAAWPWKRIIGIEFSRELQKIAASHVAEFRAPWARCRRIECVHGDVVDVRMPPGPLALFLFNPFGAPVMSEFFAQFREEERELLVLYYMPLHQNVLDRVPGLEWHRSSDHWVVYRRRESARIAE